METYEYIPVRGERMFLGLHIPDETHSSRLDWKPGCVVIASPVHEEKKSAHRPLVDLARALEARRLPCVRFDYVGTGDSTGDPSSVTLSGMTDDLRAAVQHARDATGVSNVALVGLRLGADVAALVAEDDSDVRLLALVAPVGQGRRYVRDMRMRSRIRGAMTEPVDRSSEHGDVAAAPSPPSHLPREMGARPEEGPGEGGASGRRGEAGRLAVPAMTRTATVALDYDGHPVSPRMIAELESHDLLSRTASIGASVLCLDVRAKPQPSAPLTALADALRTRAASVDARAVVDEPFWNALGPVEPWECIGAVTDWLD